MHFCGSQAQTYRWFVALDLLTPSSDQHVAIESINSEAIEHCRHDLLSCNCKRRRIFLIVSWCHRIYRAKMPNTANQPISSYTSSCYTNADEGAKFTSQDMYTFFIMLCSFCFACNRFLGRHILTFGTWPPKSKSKFNPYFKMHSALLLLKGHSNASFCWLTHNINKHLFACFLPLSFFWAIHATIITVMMLTQMCYTRVSSWGKGRTK